MELQELIKNGKITLIIIIALVIGYYFCLFVNFDHYCYTTDKNISEEEQCEYIYKYMKYEECENYCSMYNINKTSDLK